MKPGAARSEDEDGCRRRIQPNNPRIFSPRSYKLEFVHRYSHPRVRRSTGKCSFRSPGAKSAVIDPLPAEIPPEFAIFIAGQYVYKEKFKPSPEGPAENQSHPIFLLRGPTCLGDVEDISCMETRADSRHSSIWLLFKRFHYLWPRERWEQELKRNLACCGSTGMCREGT